MSKHGHMPPVPPANQSQKGPGDHSEIPSSEPLKNADVDPASKARPRISDKHDKQGLLQAAPHQTARHLLCDVTTEATMLIEFRTDGNIKGSEQSSAELKDGGP